jgi:hypothetical protein
MSNNYRFTVETFNSSFQISLEGSQTKINFKHMDEEALGYKYDYMADEVYGTLKEAKAAVRTWIREEKLRDMDRRYMLDELKEMTMQTLVDELIDNNRCADNRVEHLEMLGHDISLKAFSKVLMQWTGDEFHDRFLEVHFGHNYKNENDQLNEYAIEKFEMFRDKTSSFIHWLDHSGRRSFSQAVNSYWMEYKASHPEVA